MLFSNCLCPNKNPSFANSHLSASIFLKPCKYFLMLVFKAEIMKIVKSAFKEKKKNTNNWSEMWFDYYNKSLEQVGKRKAD